MTASARRRTPLKALGLFIGAILYLVADLYLSVGLGSWTHSDANEFYAFFAILAGGLILLFRSARRRPSAAA